MIGILNLRFDYIRRMITDYPTYDAIFPTHYNTCTEKVKLTYASSGSSYVSNQGYLYSVYVEDSILVGGNGRPVVAVNL